jgi:hypothetical protein
MNTRLCCIVIMALSRSNLMDFGYGRRDKGSRDLKKKYSTLISLKYESCQEI